MNLQRLASAIIIAGIAPLAGCAFYSYHDMTATVEMAETGLPVRSAHVHAAYVPVEIINPPKQDWDSTNSRGEANLSIATLKSGSIVLYVNGESFWVKPDMIPGGGAPGPYIGPSGQYRVFLRPKAR